MAIENFPDVRQNDEYSCGAAASMAVGLYLGIGPPTLEGWKRALGTDVQHSTDPERIIAFFRQLGREVVAQPMNIVSLDSWTDGGTPVICPVQDYGPVRSKRAQFNYGHYLTVIGVIMDQRYIVCQDSSEDNIIKPGSDSIQAPGKIVIGASEWMKVWHDKNLYNKPYINFGIAIK